MQLTLHTDYAIRVLIYLGTYPGRLVTIGEIADAYGISRNHLVKVVNGLAREGYLETVRGKHGGVRLKRPPDQIRMGEVVRYSEPIHLVECFDRETDTCPITTDCAVRGLLGRALDRFLEELDGHTLENLLQNAPRLIPLLNPEGDRVG
ncbi:MAG: Rrf2 family transcriptional regulator [Leptospirillia bacterium]